jgi:ribosomal-protein-alanine N-acetyltransferase
MRLVAMGLDHVDTIVEIERESFPIPWTREAFEYDLTSNKLAHYWTLLRKDEVIGYSGIWLFDRIAHLTTICIRDGYRGKGVGKWLLLETMSLGAGLGAQRFTLEVREFNIVAIELYKRIGYRIVGRRPKYYKEINEDALVMWTGGPPFEG